MVRAIDAAIAAHPLLTTRLVMDDDGLPRQEWGFELHAEVKETTDEELEKAKKDIIPFKIIGEPLARITIYRTPSGNYLFMDVHHIIYDGTSCALLSRDLGAAYDGKELVLDTYTMADEVAYEKGRSKEDIDSAMEFYSAFLDGIEAYSLPARDMYSDVPSVGKVTRDFTIDEAAFKSLRNSASVNRTAFFATVLGAMAAKLSGKDDSYISTIYSGRRPENAESVSMYVRSIPQVTKVSSNPSIADMVAETFRQEQGSYKHDAVPFVDLVGRFGINGDIAFAYQKKIKSFHIVAGHTCGGTMLMSDRFIPATAITVEVSENDASKGEYTLEVTFRSDMYSEGFMESFSRIYEKMCAEFLVRERLDDVEIIDEISSSMIEGFNATEVQQDLSVVPFSRMLKWMKETPESISTVSGGKKLTYGDLDRLTSGVAAYIHGKGIGRNDFVAVLIPRNEFITVASVGIIRSGAAYQPLDPSYPKDRLNFMVKDSGAKLLIADRSIRDILDGYDGDVLFTDEIAGLDPSDGEYDIRPEDPVTILYTSGTTGTPKGCIIENRNLMSFVNTHTSHTKITNESRVANYASYGFDASMMDLFGALCNGAQLHIISEDIRLDLMAMDRYFIDNQITHSLMTTQVGRQFITMTQCRSLQSFMVGGEKLVPVKPPEWTHMINGYGPTETTVYVLSCEIKDDSPLCPIGKPGDNTKVYVIDRNMHNLPIGMPGELLVAGPQVSRGYLNRPDKTSEVFVKNPFSSDPMYSRAYRTGDIVRWLPDGNIEYIGRNDGQVKVRGFRIELTEVEKVIRDYPGIKDATVAAFDAPSGGKFIAAYVVSDEKVDVESLNTFISERKPPYMVPAVTMQIDKIPLNVNSKVDKRKLPQPKIEAEDLTPPETDVQKRIFGIVKEIVGTDSFGIDTDLYSIGLTSITTIRLNVLLYNEFNVDMQIKDLKENPTVRKLGELIESKAPSKEYEELKDYPLSKTQEGIFVECVANPGSTMYNIPLLLEISKELDIPKLRESIVKAVEAHPFIRTRLFMNDSGDVRLSREDTEPFGVDDVPVEEITDLEKVKEILVQPFSIIGDRLFRFRILESPEKRYLFMDLHHIISDGTSDKLLLDSITEAYGGAVPEKERFTGFDMIMSEQDARTDDALDKAKKYYDGLLSGCEPDILPRSDLYIKGHGLGVIIKDGADASALEDYCSRIGVTMNGAMCSIFGFTLSKFCGTDEPLFSTVYNGRDDSRTSGTVAMMVKTLPVLCRVSGRTADYVRSVSQQIVDSMSNSVLSFAEISKEFSIKPDIMFVYQGSMFNFDSICGRPSKPIRLSLDAVKSPILMMITLIDGKVHYECEYDKALFSEGLIRSIVDSFDNSIKGFTAMDELADIDILDCDSRKVLERFNDTAVEQDLTIAPCALIEEWMRKTPEAEAVCFRDTRLTYSDLDRISGKVCAYLQAKGIGREDFVSILVSRSQWIALATVGVLRTGAAYQPLDPSYPKERLNFMVKDSGAKLVIVDRSLRDIIDEYRGDILYTDEIESLPDGDVRPVERGMYDAFTILYTSGTTGVPKGCVLENGNVMSIINHYTRTLDGSSKMRTASYASYGFDANMMDIFTSLCNGGALHIIPEDMRLDLPEVDRYFIDNGITHGFMTTQVGRQFITMTKCKTLKHFLVGGEKLVPVNPVPGIDFINIYGPTETSVYVTCYHVKDDNPLCPIGRPNNNTKAYVVDRNGHILPVGALGELYVAGPQVSRGYLNRPDKTSEVFIRNPFSKDPVYQRAYRTGDIVRWLPDGNIECIGRNDGQVKIRGFRVELTEVEKVIREFPDIKDATVAAFDSPSGGKFIAAYIVSDRKVPVEEINAFISERKPPYMVPAVIMQIDRIPLNVNSKVDKRKLPIPAPESSRKEGKMPRSDAEKKLCEIFGTVLGLEKVYADDDFFAIGGTSISASKLVLNCMNAGFPLVYKNVFDNPTPEKLARFISSQNSTASEEEVRTTVDSGPLSSNVPEMLDGIRSHTPRRILLTGATGYLGSHVLFELLRRNAKHIYCLVRGGKDQTAEERLKTMFMYYFGGMFDTAEFDNVSVIDTDITDPNLMDKLKGCEFDTIINCAAVVKHFAVDDSIEKVNVGGVKNLIDVAIKTDSVLVQISTESVAGESVNGSVPKDRLLKENELDIGQDLENKYAHSKYMAEKTMIDAIPSGLKAKIIRVGNLMSRDSDGEFQINFKTNAFMKQMRSYVKLGFFSVTDMDVEVEFSPIDMVAKAVVILAGTQDQYTVFHVNNCHKVHMANVLKVMRDNGMQVEVVSKKTFNERFSEALKDETKGEYVSGLISYLGNAGESRRFIGADESYTVKALYRLGFSWPLISEQYIDKAFKALKAMRFFK